jgi:hypothetical protein
MNNSEKEEGRRKNEKEKERSSTHNAYAGCGVLGFE